MTVALVVFLFHLCSTGYMIGVIWMTQLVQYPLFSRVPAEAFVAYVTDYQRRVGFVVIPFMLMELGTGLALLFLPSPLWSNVEVWGGFALLLCVWVSTFALQSPLHGRLSKGWDEALGRKLVRSNWIRTVLWTLRGVLVLVWFSRVVEPA